MDLKYKEDQPQYYFFDSPTAQASISNRKLDLLSNIELQAWQDSFRNLYYMLRKKKCDLFYVCTSQFLVTFVASEDVKRTCNACISQSTSNLRARLKDNDVNFSMPFVHYEGGAITADLFSMYDVDNGSKSRLVISGNNNVHGMYDFLINFRFTMPCINRVDVPLIYSAVSFAKSVLFSPQIMCKNVTQAEQTLDSRAESWDTPIATHFSPINFTNYSQLGFEGSEAETDDEGETEDDDEPPLGVYYDDCVPKSWVRIIWYVF